MVETNPGHIPQSYLKTTLRLPVGLLLMMTTQLAVLTSKGGHYRSMMAEWGGSLPPFTSYWLALAPFSPLLAFAAAAVSIHVIRRKSDSPRYASIAFSVISLLPWVLLAWSLVAAYLPIFAIAEALD